MKKFLILSFVFFIPMFSYSLGCIDECTNSYNSQVNDATSTYRNELSSAVWSTVKNTGGAWIARYAPGFGGLAAGFSSIGFFDPYWSIFSAEKAYDQSITTAINGFSSCVNNCS